MIKRHDGLVQLHCAILEGGADPADGPEKGFTRGERGSDERASEGRMAAEAGGRMHATTGQRCNGAGASAGEAAALSFGDRRGDSANDVSEQQTGRISYEEKLKLGKKLPVELRRSQSSVGKRGAPMATLSVCSRGSDGCSRQWTACKAPMATLRGNWRSRPKMGRESRAS